MRIAPLAFLLDPADEGKRTILRDVCRITHRHDEAYVGALAVVHAIRHVVRPGYAAHDLLTDVARALPDSQVRERIEQCAGLGEGVAPAWVGRTWGSTGFVAESVPLALFAARDIARRTFRDVVQRAIEAGGDTDTIGSIAGQVAGAYVEASGLPADLVARLCDGVAIEATARRLGVVVGPG